MAGPASSRVAGGSVAKMLGRPKRPGRNFLSLFFRSQRVEYRMMFVDSVPEVSVSRSIRYGNMEYGPLDIKTFVHFDSGARF